MRSTTELRRLCLLDGVFQKLIVLYLKTLNTSLQCRGSRNGFCWRLVCGSFINSSGGSCSLVGAKTVLLAPLGKVWNRSRLQPRLALLLKNMNFVYTYIFRLSTIDIYALFLNKHEQNL
jgi:hypothetical protein